MVRSEHLNPTDIDWRRFVVAVHDGNLVGAVQVRLHRDGARELGSLVVMPAFRRHGLAGALIDTVLRDVAGPIWMVTGRAYIGRYAEWGFAPTQTRLAPGSVLFNYRVGRAMRIVSWLKGRKPKYLTLLVRGPVRATPAVSQAWGGKGFDLPFGLYHRKG